MDNVFPYSLSQCFLPSGQHATLSELYSLTSILSNSLLQIATDILFTYTTAQLWNTLQTSFLAPHYNFCSYKRLCLYISSELGHDVEHFSLKFHLTAEEKVDILTLILTFFRMESKNMNFHPRGFVIELFCTFTAHYIACT